MAILERVIQLKKGGMSDSQIIDILRQEGVSPKEINDALNQSKIKSTITQNLESSQTEFSNMKPSIMLEKREKVNNEEPSENEEEYLEYQEPAYENIQKQEPVYYEDQNYQNYPYYNPDSTYEYYPEYQAPKEQLAIDIETINDIVEQIIEEKNSELNKQVSELKRFKDETKIDLDRINERLLKLENTFNDLQIAILKKIGEYGENIQEISNEMRATQDSFSKILNPLTDNIRELQKIVGMQNSKKETDDSEKKEEDKKRIGKQKPSFEEYLR
ncbi:MAG: hypothetical protein QXW97_01845 [Candidatus Pacearchaeota archaeon]